MDLSGKDKARAALDGKRYDAFAASFRLESPATFNFGVDVVDHWAAAGDGLALLAEDQNGRRRSFSFGDISRLTNRFANVLRAHGVGKGDRVLVMFPRIPEWMIAVVGALKIGAVAIPCIEMLTARDVEYRVRNSGAKAFVCRREQVEKFALVADVQAARLCLDGSPGWLDLDAEMAKAAETLVPATVAADDPAMLYYTSGSTGHPKGVLHASRGIHAWRLSAIHWLDLAPGERIWCTADIGWSKAGTSILFGPWSCGAASLIYDGPFDAGRRLKLLQDHRITVYCAPGTELFRLVDEPMPAFDLSALRRTVSAGEAVNPAIARRWEAATGLRVAEAYGQTEALMLLLNYPGEPVKYGSMGRPTPGCDVDVIDDKGSRLPAGTEGNVALLAPAAQLMLGYWGEPERTAACYVESPEGRWYITGDRGEKDDQGYFWYRGRLDDLINSAGYRIGPLEVENALLEHEAVQSCAVIGAPDAERGEMVKAFVVLRPGFAPSAALTKALQDHAKAVTAPYKYPRAVEYVAELPMTQTGKIRRRTLKEREVERAAGR